MAAISSRLVSRCSIRADPTQHGYGDRSESLEILVDTEVPAIDLLDMIDEDDVSVRSG